MMFKKDFAWGTATSAYQIEGAVNEDERGASVWDVFSHQPGKTAYGHTGDIACDHYHRFRQDVELMAQLGVKAYRFSVSWSRILPEGTGVVSKKGLQFYSDLVDCLLLHGIVPYITLYHWDLPYALYLRGGWLNPDSPRWFAEYAAVVGRRLGARVKHFITMNEPQVFIGCSFVQGVHAPGVRMERKECLQMAHHVLLAHGLAVQSLRAEVPNAQIGIAPTSEAALPADQSTQAVEAARRAFFSVDAGDDWVWSVAWWSDPILLGHYPEDGLRVLGQDLPQIGQNDLTIISQPIDFYGQNIYRGRPMCKNAQGQYQFAEHKAGAPKTAIGWFVDFDCLYWASKFLYERYQKPIYITENGMSSHDWISLDGKVHDSARIDYLHRHLQGLRRAAEEGVEIAGYFQWSLLDNFEWAQGYGDRFGLVYVDFETQQRIPKDSFAWYQSVISQNGGNL